MEVHNSGLWTMRIKRPSASPTNREFFLNGALRPYRPDSISVALIFPNSYDIGMANLGFQTVYSILSRNRNIAVERFFIPSDSSDTPFLSVEAGRRLQDFDLLMFSVSFEADYLNLLRALSSSGIPLRAKDRDDSCPLVIAGGVATFINPEPVALFVDAFILGDFEATATPFLNVLPQILNSTLRREQRLRKLVDSVPGAYVPGFYTPHWDKEGKFCGWTASPGLPFPVKTSLLREPRATAPHSCFITSDSIFSDIFLVEMSRGCGRGCRFCAAGFVYRPHRPWPAGTIEKAMEHCRNTDRVGLIGLEVLGRGDTEKLCQKLMKRGLRLTFSSLRADSVNPDFAAVLKGSGAKVATIAPEAGSQRLRDAINKNLEEDQIVDAAVLLAEAGIPNLKLYFMMGLPFEHDEDVEEIGQLVERIQKEIRPIGRARGRMGEITVSISTFVPKAWTPFQWARFVDKRALKHRRSILRRIIGPLPNTRLKLDSARGAWVQSVLSRGDRRLGDVMERVVLKGMSWNKALKECGLDGSGLWDNPPGFNDPMPWDIVGHRVRKSYLVREWKRAERGKTTRPCQVTKCSVCGACA